MNASPTINSSHFFPPSVKPTSRSWTVFRWGSKAFVVSALVYGVYLLGYGVYRTGHYLCDRSLHVYSRLMTTHAPTD